MVRAMISNTTTRMKEHLPLIAALCTGLATTAQPVLTYDTHTPPTAGSIAMAQGNFVDPGPAGPNVTWDLSGAQSEFAYQVTFLAGDQIPNAAFFPGIHTASLTDGTYDALQADAAGIRYIGYTDG
jgi:hypothetical protein